MKILPSNNGRRISLSCLDMTYYLPWNWHSHSPWKDESSFWDLAYFQGRTVSFRQCIHWFNQRYSVLPVLLFYILFGSCLLFLILRELGSSVPLLRKFPDVTSNSYGFKCEATFQKLFFFIWCIVSAFKHFPDFSTPTSFEITRISWLTSSLVFLTASRETHHPGTIEKSRNSLPPWTPQDGERYFWSSKPTNRNCWKSINQKTGDVD